MNFQQRHVIAVPRESLWDFIMQVPLVAGCVPGVTEVEQIDDTTYRGTLKLQVGPIRLNLEGRIGIQHQDKASWQAAMRADASDRRISGGVKADMHMALLERSATETELVITTNASFLGKLGEFGQPIIRKKADAILQEFARNLQVRLGSGSAVS